MTASLVEALEKAQNAQRDMNDLQSNEAERKEVKPKSADRKRPISSSRAVAEPTADTQGDRIDYRTGAMGQAAQTSVKSFPENPSVISHSQVIDLSRQLKAHNLSPSSLDILLRGARVYVPPPLPKPEPTSDYKALMARLRREEEHRAYERMTRLPSPMETFAQRFPATSAAHAFSSNLQSMNRSNQDDDEVTYADVDRQMALIFNVLISIVACAGAIWVVARWWSTPARLALSMGGSILVGVAEVVIYSGYIRRVGDAKASAKDLKDVKEVLTSWVVGGEDDENRTNDPVVVRNDTNAPKPRRRKGPRL